MSVSGFVSDDLFSADGDVGVEVARGDVVFGSKSGVLRMMTPPAMRSTAATTNK